MSAGDTEAQSAIVYIDGLNLYGSALKGSHFKWADLMAVTTELVPSGFALAAVKYFSADLHPDVAEDPASLRRQRNYLKALRATGVDVRRGTFVAPTRWRTVSTAESWADRLLPAPTTAVAAELDALEAGSPRPMKVRVRLPEEKFTDVAIGVELVDDFHQGDTDLAVLVTNDGDLRPAIEKVVAQGHRVHVVSPAPTVNRHLGRAATSSEPIPPTCLEDHQLPDEFTDAAGTKHSRPSAWKAGK